MKIAIMMSGEIRTLAECVDSFTQHIWKPIEAAATEVRLFVHTPSGKDSHLAYQLLPGAIVEIEPQPGFDEANFILRSGKGVCGVQTVLAQMWGWARVGEMASQWPHDFAVRVRPDTLYYNSIECPSTWKPGTFYAPRFASFWGLCDRFGYGDSTIMARWMATGARLEELLALGYAFHPESLYAEAIKPCTLERTNVLFATVRDNGILRTPQFMKEIGDVAL